MSGEPGARPLSPANAALIAEYLDIAVHAPEDLARTLAILADDCVWRITPPGIEFRGPDELRSFVGLAMGSRRHGAGTGVVIRRCFTDGEHLCVEYFHGAVVGRLHVRIAENVCLICHMRDGRFDRVDEYVDTSGSWLVALGLRLLPYITRGRRARAQAPEVHSRRSMP